MFGISFGELLLVALIALAILGPERLPGAVRTTGLWVGRLKRSFNSLKQEVEKEIGADEIRRQLHNEHILSLEKEAKKALNFDLQPDKPAVDSSAITAAVPDEQTPAAVGNEPSSTASETPRTP